MSHQNDSEILAQEQQLTDATRALDLGALDRLYADDIIFTGVTGAVCDKAALMDEARRGRAERAQAAASPAGAAVVGYAKDEIRVVRHGDCAVASFRFGVTIRHDGSEVVRRYRTTNVWMKRGGAWMVAAAQTTALG
jgi:ketosteroid isomerase-like protein